MKKLAILLSLSFLIPLVSPALSHGASNYSDLAIGDPMGGGYKRQARRRPAKPAAPASSTANEKAAPAAPATPEKPAEPAK